MFLLDILFPKTCLACGRLGNYICLDCQKKILPINDKFCFYCGGETISHNTHPACQRVDGVDGLFVFFQYHKILRKIIKNIKYRGVKEALDELISLTKSDVYRAMAATIKAKVGEKRMALVSFIPLSRSRRARRGFNQAELIASRLAKRLGLKQRGLLIKKKVTTPQASTKDRDQRKINLRGVFKLKKSRQSLPKMVFLADDVLTTGATIGEATRVLKKAGVRFVFAVTLAKV